MAGKVSMCGVLCEESYSCMYGWIFLGSGELALNCKSVVILKFTQLVAK